MKFPTAKRPLASAALFGVVCLAGLPADAADGKGMAYVTNQNGDVTVIDLATLETVSEIEVGAEGPRGLGVTADGTLLVTANGEAGNLSVIDRATGELVRQVADRQEPGVRARSRRHRFRKLRAGSGRRPPAQARLRGSQEAGRGA